MMSNKKMKTILVLILTFIIINNEKILALTASPGISFQAGAGGDYISSDEQGKVAEHKTRTFLVTLIDENGNRVALIDEKGNKVGETKSVYYIDSTNKDFKTIANSISCKYKYSSVNDTCVEYQTDITGNGATYYNEMDTIGEKFQDNIVGRNKIYTLSGSEKFDFLTSFLYHCGYLDKSEGYYDIEDSHWNKKRNEIAKNHYFILLEPIYEFYLKGQTYNGTSRELAEVLLRFGANGAWNLQSAVTYNLGINVYTTQDKANELEYKRITKGIMNMVKSSPNAGVPEAEWRAISSPEYGNGMGIIAIWQGVTTTNDVPINITKTNCTTDGEERPNGIVSFDIDIEEDDFDSAAKAGLEFEQRTTSSGKIHCYDNVTYDFTNVINGLNGIVAREHSYADIDTGKITVKRVCNVNISDVEYDTEKTTFMNNFSIYENIKIPLTAFGQKVELEKISTSESGIQEPTKSFGTIYGIYKVTKTITFGYKKNNSKIYIKSNPTIKSNENIESYIDFSGITYGYSNKLYNNATDGKKYDDNDNRISFTINMNSTAGGKKCMFETGTSEDGIAKIKFRTISLDNPFPARDATTRLPGSNWLNDINYANTYINHNRGVKGSDVYTKEPIYTITLTPKQMIKIREYNNKHSYSDISLNCVGENNTSCFSQFLRTQIENSNFEGECSKVNSGNIRKDPNGIRNITIDEMMDITADIRNSTNPINYDITGINIYDYNGDGIITYRDLQIFDNAEKTTNYYTCADKTYENSGYMVKGGINE